FLWLFRPSPMVRKAFEGCTDQASGAGLRHPIAPTIPRGFLWRVILFGRVAFTRERTDGGCRPVEGTGIERVVSFLGRWTFGGMAVAVDSAVRHVAAEPLPDVLGDGPEPAVFDALAVVCAHTWVAVSHD